MAKQFSVFVNIGGRLSPSFGNAVKSAEDRLAGFSRQLQRRAAESAKAMKGMGESAKALAGSMAAGGLGFSMKHAFGDGADLAHEIQGMRNAGRSAHEVAEGIEAATAAIAKLPTSTLTNGIKLLNETTGAFGDYHHAVENLTFNSKLADVLKNTVHVEDPVHALGSMIKALEIRGSAANPETYRREAEKLTQAMTFFGGRLKPEDIYTFASNAQVGVRQLNERFLTRIAPSMIQELGGDKVGTGLTAFRTIISGRKISDNAQAKEWSDLGLLDKSKLIHNKMGDVKGWKEGAVKDTTLAYQDPLEYMEKVILPTLQEKRGTDITDPIKLGAALNSLFKNTKANAFVAAISTVIDRTRLKKDETLINKVLSLDDNYNSSLLNDPKLAQSAIKSAMTNIGAAITLPMMKPLAMGLIGIARALNRVSAALMSNPEAAKVVAGIAAALTAMAAIRLASFVFGLAGLGRALMFLSIAMPFTLAGRLIATARGISAIAAASALGVAGRLRALAAGIVALGAVGGVRAVLATVGASILAFGRAVLLFPFTLLRVGFAGLAALIAPVGLAVAAVTVALAALGLWVYNNLAGLGTFFTTFGESFMKALGPETSNNVENVVGHLKTAWTWINALLGPLDASGAKWKEWGEWAGQGAAAVVTALTALPEKIGTLAKQGYDALVNFDWSEAGKAIVDGIVDGIARGAGALTDALKGAVSSAWDAAKGAIGLGGGSSAAPASSAPSIAGRRANGGSVTGGLPYLVGERGPEIFVPSTTGRIETNGVLNSLSKAGGRATGDGGLKVGVDASAVEEAGESAKKAGAQLHASLDTTTRPIVDTTSIDAGTVAAEKLKAVLAIVGGSSISVGGAGGQGGGESGQGGAALAGPGRAGRSVGGAASKAGTAPTDASGGKSFGARADLTEGARESYNFWREKGLSHAAAAGFAGSEQGENNFKAHGYGDRGHAYGSMMWQGPRQRQILAGTGVNVIGASHRQQLEAAHWEMTKGPDGGARKAWALAQTAKTPGEAAAIHVDHYERPLDRGLNKRVRGGYANAWAKKFAEPAPTVAAKESPTVLAGARERGGPVASGLSYLVGERGPEIFTAGATGQISTNGALNSLAEFGRAAIDGSGENMAPSAGTVAKLRPDGGNVSTRGDTHYAPTFQINGAQDPAAIRREVSTHFSDLIRQYESEQRGSLSD